ncbi:MAG TPA: DUF2231 domain-containing protein [Opitutaceae bacterium]|nr:DUF2231 domain-containing protein [Opitutaceae bacterium]
MNSNHEVTMHTPASIAGHPIHPMLVPIAIGGFLISLVADIICIATGNTQTWNTVAYYTMLVAIAGALVAALPGLVDLLSLPADIRKTAVTHMTINLIVVALYIWNAWLRHGDPSNLKMPMILSFIGVGLLVISGWLGGKMVYEQGVAVNTPVR